MAQYGDSKWKALTRERSKMRDEVRTRFLSENGTTPATSFDDVGMSPKMMQPRILKLLEITGEGEVGSENKDLMNALTALMSTTGFGLGGPMADTVKTVMSLQSYDLMSLLNHFTGETQNRFRL